MQRWITDTDTTERFPLYTRGNADEVGPQPFSPLTWTLAWEQGAAPGTADGWVNLGGFRADEFRWPVPEVFGCWGGYFYNQVSVGRVFGVRMPGGSPDAIDQAYFGGRPDVPAYVPDPRDDDPELSGRLAGTMEWVLSTQQVPFLDTFVEQVHRWATERPDLRGLDDAALVAHGRAANHRLRLTWDVYARVVIAASVGPGVAQALASAMGRPEQALALFTSLGGVATASTSYEVWRLSRLVRRSTAVTAAFDGGVPGLMDRLRATGAADGERFAEAFDGLLADHGHRGPNEWDLMSDTWLTRPELALSMIDQVRHQSDDRAPQARSGDGTALRESATAELLELSAGDPQAHGTLTMAIHSGQLFYRLREAGKDAAVRVMLEAKLPFHELGRRWTASGALAEPGDVFMLLESELDDAVADPMAWRSRLADRSVQFATLADREPPYTVCHGESVPPIADWPSRRAVGAAGRPVAAGRLLGIGVSPGVVTGRARVVGDLSEAAALEPGDILVCATTDPSWVPLFMVAGGVVCEIGAQASHAAIVSRELGVPCVVSVAGATSQLSEGDLVRLDGTAGTVDVVQA